MIAGRGQHPLGRRGGAREEPRPLGRCGLHHGRLEELVRGPERERPLELAAARVEHAEAGHGRTLARPAEQRALPGAGGALHEHEPPPSRPRVGAHEAELVQLVVAFEEVRAQHRSARSWLQLPESSGYLPEAKRARLWQCCGARFPLPYHRRPSMAVACTRAHRLAFVALLAAALLAIMGTADAHAQQYYKVVNRYSGMCLDVAHASPAHLARVIHGRCPGAGGYNQQWSLVGTDSGYYRYRARHSGKCLDVAHVSIAHGTPVIQGDCWSPGLNQQWRFVAADGGWGQLRPRHSDMCLDSYQFQHGSDVRQLNCGNGVSQHWRLVPTS